MNFTKINNSLQPSDTLLIFFNGWAMTPEVVDFLILPEKTDLLICSNYTSFNTKSIIDISSYKSFHLVAWSMGVWAAEKILKSEDLFSFIFSSIPYLNFMENLHSRVAICGTSLPRNNEIGIPNDLYDATIEQLSDENRTRFNRRMCGGKSLQHLFDSLKERETQEIKKELMIAKKSSQELQTDLIDVYNWASKLWTFAWIANKDRIIPTENQLRWVHTLQIPYLLLENEAHYIFKYFNEWKEILYGKNL